MHFVYNVQCPLAHEHREGSCGGAVNGFRCVQNTCTCANGFAGAHCAIDCSGVSNTTPGASFRPVSFSCSPPPPIKGVEERPTYGEAELAQCKLLTDKLRDTPYCREFLISFYDVGQEEGEEKESR